MQTRTLGRNGPAVSALGLGCMGMSEFYGEHSDAESLATLNHALERGVTFLDTADVYGPYTNEQLIGRALHGRRESAFIATKFGFVRDPGNPAIRGIDGRPARVREACEASLRRLNSTHIDLYYLHRADPQVPIEDTVGAMAQLVRAGKVRYLGLSEVSPQTLERAHGVHPITALQSEYSLWFRDHEKEILPTVEELGIGFVAYSPLGKGFLTGKIDESSTFDSTDFRSTLPRFKPEARKANLALVELIGAIAERKKATPAQTALAWVLAQKPWIVPIPGTTKLLRLGENIGALAVELTPADLSEIESAASKITVQGERYPEAMAKLVGR